ncbi:hypothetical protein FOCC_FOCC004041 [Frankliniella occidentalis]|nr:hypothetical protein FOCC_FOCC004041 [Frankliniella occidentalis]
MKTPVSRKAPRGQYLQWTIVGAKMPRSTKCNRKKAEKGPTAYRSSSKSRSTPLTRKNSSVIRRHPLSELAIRQLEPVTPKQLSLPGKASLSASPPLISIPIPTQTIQDDEMPSLENPVNYLSQQSPEQFPPRERDLISPDQPFSPDREFPLDALEVQLQKDDGFYLVDDEDGVPNDTCLLVFNFKTVRLLHIHFTANGCI